MASTVDAKLLKSTKFPPEFNQKVDMQKVNLEVMKKWIAGKISEILGNEDDVVIELCFNLIEGSRYPDIKKLQIQLTGFLEKDTPKFCQELWKLCLSAQSNAQGVPKELLEAKKLELIQEKIESDRAAEEARRRRDIDQRRDREMDSIRNRERVDRGRGGGRGDWGRGRGDRGGRDFDRRGPRYSRSPPPRRREDSRDRSFRGQPPPRDIDSYVPGGRGGRGGGRRDAPRRRSPSPSDSGSRSRSRSASPPRRRRSPSRSVSPAPRRRRSATRSVSPRRDRRTYHSRGGRDVGRNSAGRNRRRSYTPSDRDSRSPSPRSRKRRRSPSVSASPPKHRARRNTSSASSSRSLSASSRGNRTPKVRRGRDAGAQDPDEMDIITTGSIARKDHRDERRLTRSNSGPRSMTPPRKNHRNPPRSRSRSPDGRDGKRRRSIQRYAPASKKRRTSSVSSQFDARDKRADSSDRDRRPPARRSRSRSPTSREPKPARLTDTSEKYVKNPQHNASELREKLLREKIKKMRTGSSSSS